MVTDPGAAAPAEHAVVIPSDCGKMLSPVNLVLSQLLMSVLSATQDLTFSQTARLNQDVPCTDSFQNKSWQRTDVRGIAVC